MLAVLWSTKKDYSAGSCKGPDEEIWLWHSDQSTSDSGPAPKTMKPVFYVNEIISPSDQAESSSSSYHDHKYYSRNCFLKSCHLCHKPLLYGKQVYIYRGELGFCSDECRSRQMYLDEMKKIEISTKRILASFHQRHRGAWWWRPM